MSSTSIKSNHRRILETLVKEISSSSDKAFENEFTHRVSDRPLSDLMYAPSASKILSSLSLSLEACAGSNRALWNPVIVAYHKAVTSLVLGQSESIGVNKNGGRKYREPSGKTGPPSVSSQMDDLSLNSKPGKLSYANVAKTLPSRRGKPPATPNQRHLELKAEPQRAKPPKNAFRDVLTVWEAPQFPCYHNTKHIKCADTDCAFCRGLILHLPLTPCEVYPESHYSEKCTPSGWFPHIGIGLWGSFMSSHKKKKTFKPKDSCQEYSLAWFQSGNQRQILTPKRKGSESTDSPPVKSPVTTPLWSDQCLSEGEVTDSEDEGTTSDLEVDPPEIELRARSRSPIRDSPPRGAH